MKQLIKINDLKMNSVDHLWETLQHIQLYNGFNPVDFELIKENEIISFKGLVTEMGPLGQTRIKFTAMYYSIEHDNVPVSIETSFNIYIAKDIFHCCGLRGFMTIIASDSEIEDLEKEE